jgi:hypothetical protein
MENNMKDVVIGCITNYTFEHIKLFVNSIDRSGFRGHKVMIVYNVPFSTVNELKKRGWIVVAFNEDVENQRYTYRDKFIVTVDRHLHYYLTLKQLAEEHFKKCYAKQQRNKILRELGYDVEGEDGNICRKYLKEYDESFNRRKKDNR